MGRRRFEYAAAFFLLADDLKSAMSVLSNQLGDIQLAIAVGRVYGGDNSQPLRDLLETRILPAAARDGNRWQATWCYWILGQRSLAVRALVNPLHLLLEPPGSPPESSRAKSFLNDDPALVVLYKQLREKSLQTLKGALMISGKEEWEFITKTASLLLRMGCDVLALDLVRNWEFLQQHRQAPRHDNGNDEGQESVGDLPHRRSIEMDPRKLLRRRSSLVVADMPEATQPPSASILDNWGFSPPPAAEQQSQRSMLDDWATSPEQSKQGNRAARSTLDEGITSSAPTKGQTDTATRSMLDDFDMPPESNQPPPSTRSMLDDWSSDTQTALPIRSSNQARFQDDDDGMHHKSQKPQEDDEKTTNGTSTNSGTKHNPPPSEFKEPDPNSLLDSFGF